MSWLDKIIPPKIQTRTGLGRKGVPEGVWSKCGSCQAVLYGEELKLSHQVCPKCDHHMRIGGKDRLNSFLDTDSIELIGEQVTPLDILKFKDQKRYKDRLSDAKKASHSSEAAVAAAGRLMNIPVTVVAFDFRFLGGSMGSVVGERFVRAADYALEHRIPLISFSASGGARMQEALYSLMQMAKTSAAIARNRQAGIPFISVLTDPTMGGVSASLAMLGDVIIAEPKALVGFAGPRVIEQTVRETLPDGFQRAEFLLEHGAIDMILDRRQMRREIAMLLAKLGFGAEMDLEGDNGITSLAQQDPDAIVDNQSTPITDPEPESPSDEVPLVEVIHQPSSDSGVADAINAEFELIKPASSDDKSKQ